MTERFVAGEYLLAITVPTIMVALVARIMQFIEDDSLVHTGERTVHP